MTGVMGETGCGMLGDKCRSKLAEEGAFGLKKVD